MIEANEDGIQSNTLCTMNPSYTIIISSMVDAISLYANNLPNALYVV